MNKTVSFRDVSALKKMAQIVNPLVTKKQNLLKKISAYTAEIEGPEGLNAQIAGMEAGIKMKFCGYGTEDLIKKTVTPAVREDGTPILDAKTGKQLTKTTWEPTSLLKYNEEGNNYILYVPTENVNTVSSTPYGSDFDLDSESIQSEKEMPANLGTSYEGYTDDPFNF